MNSPIGWVRCENFLRAPTLFRTPRTLGEGLRRRAITLLFARKANAEIEKTLLIALAASQRMEDSSAFTDRFNSYRSHVVPFVEDIKKADARKVAEMMDKKLEKMPLVVRPLTKNGGSGADFLMSRMPDGKGGGDK